MMCILVHKYEVVWREPIKRSLAPWMIIEDGCCNDRGEARRGDEVQKSAQAKDAWGWGVA